MAAENPGRDFDSAERVLTAATGLGKRDKELRPLIDELKWLGDLEQLISARGGAAAPIRICRGGEAWAIRNIDVAGDGVYKSTDGGKTWTNMGLPQSGPIGRILIDPSNANSVYVYALGRLAVPQQDRGIYHTGDGGKSWQHQLLVDANTGCLINHATEAATEAVRSCEDSGYAVSVAVVDSSGLVKVQLKVGIDEPSIKNAISIASWSATSFANDPSGSVAPIARKRAWMSSIDFSAKSGQGASGQRNRRPPAEASTS